MSDSIAGIRLGVAQAGLKVANQDDLVVVELASGTRTAALFTQNAFRAAPVVVAERHLSNNQGLAQFLLINTGNANAGIGAMGIIAAENCCDAVADLASVNRSEVLPFSTGVIGEPLDADRIVAALPSAIHDLGTDNWQRAAAAILTTDTRPKLRTTEVDVDGKVCRITGMSKGAGMICPNLATMLAFIATDAEIEQSSLETLLRRANSASFNRITVDGDTSTNDAVTLSASGLSGVRVDSDTPAFAEALSTLMIELAQDIVRDGEGATKFVAICVSGGETQEACEQVGRTIAHSPLVKTALFSSDPNWGRILAAIGRAGLSDLITDDVSIRMNGVLIAERGARASRYTEEQGQEAMAASDLTIEVALNRGQAEATIWTTDLSYDYVKINAEYRT
jgi:glutamate N-acetyltransferase/amino-acid N-acetyltransferase